MSCVTLSAVDRGEVVGSEGESMRKDGCWATKRIKPSKASSCGPQDESTDAEVSNRLCLLVIMGPYSSTNKQISLTRPSPGRFLRTTESGPNSCNDTEFERIPKIIFFF